jgi:hypothetical protein
MIIREVKLANGDTIYIDASGKYTLDWGFGDPEAIFESEAKELIKKHNPEQFDILFGQPSFEAVGGTEWCMYPSGEGDETGQKSSSDQDYKRDF